MRMPIVLSILLGSSLLHAPAMAQQETAATADSADPDHAALRALREELTAAVLAGDIDAQMALTDENVVTTWQNGRVARGQDGLREFMQEMTAGAENVFQGYTVQPTADDLSILHDGDTAIAYGSSVPHYRYLGMEFDLENRWTATLVKRDGEWKVAAYHVSADITDNPFLAAARQSLVWTGGIAAAIGIVIGALGTRLLRPRPAPESTPAH